MSRKDTKFLQSILKEYRRSLDYFTILIIIRPGSEQNKTVMSHVWESQVEQPKAEDYLYDKVIYMYALIFPYTYMERYISVALAIRFICQ